MLPTSSILSALLKKREGGIFYIKHWKVKSFITHLDYELARDKSTDNLRHEPDEGLT